ncbi:hypothetical protein EXIGLDRAFT_789128 [Exidia glandulosa HHB12029]|uniref:Uncharacterized protein n=1 Tax=Exidia glandulosa HHB12029 TaxID=1314781 RepID=A0A166MLV1_EXIGL|nr:hypothetical protein EXIGLDRAFT_789128 [Exidia glandulosa HHB12029]
MSTISTDEFNQLKDSVADLEKGMAGINTSLQALLARSPAQSSSASPATSSTTSATTTTTPQAATATAAQHVIAPRVVDLWAVPGSNANIPAQPAAPAAIHLAPGILPGAAATQTPYAGKSAPVRFPDIEQPVLQSALAHTLDFKDLIKLNPDYYSSSSSDNSVTVVNGQHTVTIAGVSSSTNTKPTKHFPNINALVGSFLVYFDILFFNLGLDLHDFESTWTLMHGGQLFTRHLLRLSESYSFSAILKYAQRFYNYRRSEMTMNIFTGWWFPDTSLMQELALPPRTFQAPSSRQANSTSTPNTGNSGAFVPRHETICRNFQLGTCPDPCKYGRKHVSAPASSSSTPTTPATK